jgi:hypothetical protein
MKVLDTETSLHRDSDQTMVASKSGPEDLGSPQVSFRTRNTRGLYKFILKPIGKNKQEESGNPGND